ncbi:MAG: hypothetical protein DME08_03780 [Candidatus Rokuibacteriota bacterium]|nr:MAG: hypothetical protein DME08_03780 [Candidatus Rokubacteria bacterium]PYN99134.1 MAG: hypothetical protein DMD89_12075 [Candidatus Rokubacteria bacterium]
MGQHPTRRRHACQSTSGILPAVRRPLLGLLAALVVVGAIAGALAWLLNDPKPPTGANHAERLYYAYCVTCHGVDGRGSWRAALFLIRPGDLPSAARSRPERYLFDIIKHGGAPLGRPGMPAFGYHLSDADIEALVVYLKTLDRRPAR